MNKGLFVRICICVAFFGFCLYSYLDLQNSITQMRISIPKLTKQLQRVEEENMRLSYEIEAFESPGNLMKLAQNCEYSHLEYPLHKEILTVQMDSLDEMRPGKRMKKKPSITFAQGVTP